MSSRFIITRSSAIGNTVSSLATSSASSSPSNGVSLEVVGIARNELRNRWLPQPSSSSGLCCASMDSCPGTSSGVRQLHAMDRDDSSGSSSGARLTACSSLTGLNPSPTFASQSMPPAHPFRSCRSELAWPGAPRRSLHTSAAAAMAAAPAVATGQQQRRAAGAPRRRAQLSPHAYEFQRRFFQLVNTTVAPAAAAAAGAASSPDGRGGTNNPSSVQAIRMLLAWLEEGKAALAAEQQEQQQQEGQGAAAAPAAAAPRAVVAASSAAPARGVAAPYMLEQAVIDRAMDELWRLYYKGDVRTRKPDRRDHGGRDDADAAAAARVDLDGPMGLRELLTAAEVLAAAAPAMDLSFKKQHYDLLLELYGRRAAMEASFRTGAARKMLDVRQQMVQQLLPVSQTSLNHLLLAVRRDPQVPPGEKLATAVRLISRDLPVVNLSARSHSSGPSSGAGEVLLTKALHATLCSLLKDAASARDWTAYQKLEAVLISRTNKVPPYDVLVALLGAAAEDGLSELALGVLAQIEAQETSEPQPSRIQQLLLQAAAAQQQQQQQGPARRGGPGGSGTYAARSSSSSSSYGSPDPYAGVEVLMAQMLGEAGAMERVLATAVAQGNEGLAEKAYERVRHLSWRNGTSAVINKFIAARAARLEQEKAEEERKKAAAAEEESDDEEEEGRQKNKGTAEGDYDEEGEGEGEGEDGLGSWQALDAPEARIAMIRAAMKDKMAPPAATLQMLDLALSRKDWGRVLDLVGSLAEFQSMCRRTKGLIQRFMCVTIHMDRMMSAYGGLGRLSQVLMESEESTVEYYSELLRRIAAAAASGTAIAPFGGSYVPFGPPLRAAAGRRDLASVAEIIRQMKGLGCQPRSDSYAAVIEASLRGGKPQRVAGLLALMEDEGLQPNAAVWEVQIAAATEAGDMDALVALSDRVLVAATPGSGKHNSASRPQWQGVADVDPQIVAAAIQAAEARGNHRAAQALQLLARSVDDLRRHRDGMDGQQLSRFEAGRRQAWEEELLALAGER